MKRNATAIAVQAAGQLALIGAVPILTRVYGPASLGSYQLATSIALVVQPIASRRLEFRIPVEPHGGGAVRQYRSGVLFAAVLSAVLAGGALAARWQGHPHLAGTLLMVGTLLFATALAVLDNALLVRDRAFMRLGVRNFVSAVVAVLIQLAFAWAGGPVVGLAFAILGGRLAGILTTRVAVSSGVAPVPESASASSRSLTTTVVTIMAGVVSNSSVYGLTILTAALASPMETGQVGTAQRITSSPVGLIGQALSQQYQGLASANVRDGRPVLAPLTRRFVWRIGAVALALAATMAVLGPILATPVLGREWHDAGVVIALLALPVAMQIAIAPTIPLLVMLGRERVLLTNQLVRLCGGLLAGGIPVLVFHANYLWMVGGYALATTAAYLATLVLTLRVAAAHDATVRSAASARQRS
ncbi:MAG: oligosaccharide flippase family protein [Nocardioides sp.]|uniref:lipopolysaccharide biosynthesis protein n=1 Tax=Nocardioides sp. TaxID=35761 RepID=UPI0039E5D3DD